MAHQRDTTTDRPDGRVIRPWDDDEAVIRLERAAVRRLRGRDILVERSSVGSVSAGRITVSKGNAGLVAGQSVAVDGAHVGVLIAPVVRGEVHTWLDMRSAIFVGLGIVLGRSVLRLLLPGNSSATS